MRDSSSSIGTTASTRKLLIEEAIEFRWSNVNLGRRALRVSLPDHRVPQDPLRVWRFDRGVG